MRYRRLTPFLDTCALLYLASGSKRLTRHAKELIDAAAADWRGAVRGPRGHLPAGRLVGYSGGQTSGAGANPRQMGATKRLWPQHRQTSGLRRDRGTCRSADTAVAIRSPGRLICVMLRSVVLPMSRMTVS